MGTALDDLRASFDAFMQWQPISLLDSCSELRFTHEDSETGQRSGYSRPCGTCAACLGAKRALAWIIECCAAALKEVENVLRPDKPSSSYFAIEWGKTAARIEGLFGSPGPVYTFSKRVEEFCASRPPVANARLMT